MFRILPMLCLAVSLSAQSIIWQEDGSGLNADPAGFRKQKAWLLEGVDTEKLDDGGFRISVKEGAKNGVMKRMLPVSAESYLVIDIGEAAPTAGKYNAITFGLNNLTPNQVSLVRNIMPSVICLEPFKGYEGKEKQAAVSFYLYGASLDIKSIRLQQNPPYRVEILPRNRIKTGDKVTFRVHIPRKVKDISLTFTTPRGDKIKINGQTSLQLLPPNETSTYWEAELEIKSLELPPSYKKGPAAAIAYILGGDMRKPLITNLYLSQE